MDDEFLFGALMVIFVALLAIVGLQVINGLTLFQIRQQMDEIKNDTAFLKQHND